MISLLTGRALSWATAQWEAESPDCARADTFSASLLRVFNHPVSGREASRRLNSLKQGSRSVSEFSIEFRTLAAESKWNDEALMSAFYSGLSEAVKDELASREWGPTLDGLITIAICLDQRIQERRRERRQHHPGRPATVSTSPSPSSAQAQEEPMEVDRYRLNPTEKERRRREKLCLYCGAAGHFRDRCTKLQGNALAHEGQGTTL